MSLIKLAIFEELSIPKKKVFKKYKPSLYQTSINDTVRFEDQKFKEYNALTSQGGKVVG